MPQGDKDTSTEKQALFASLNALIDFAERHDDFITAAKLDDVRVRFRILYGQGSR